MRRALPALAALVLALLALSGCSLLEAAAVDPPPEDYVSQDAGFRYTRDQLTGQEQYIYDQLLAGLQDQADRIEDLYPNSDMIQAAIRAIDRDCPELFWFSGTGQIETSLVGDTPMEAAYLPNYVMDPDQRAAAQAQIDGWAADCFAGLPAGASDYDKALHVYEYIIDHADYQAVDDNSIVNIMVEGKGLCGCYAKTAQYLLNQLGVPCAYVSGQAGGETHAWNLMWLDGVPCWMDVTWGDPVFEGGQPASGPAYEYFGLTTEDLLRTHTLDGTVAVPDCTSQDYNYLRRSGLYFGWYDPAGITAAMETALREGWTKLPLRFGDDGYQEAASVLFEQGQIHRLFRAASASTGVALDLTQSIWYSRNDEMCTVTVNIPY